MRGHLAITVWKGEGASSYHCGRVRGHLAITLWKGEGAPSYHCMEG